MINSNEIILKLKEIKPVELQEKLEDVLKKYLDKNIK